jgi:hypothetical protein
MDAKLEALLRAERERFIRDVVPAFEGIEHVRRDLHGNEVGRGGLDEFVGVQVAHGSQSVELSRENLAAVAKLLGGERRLREEVKAILDMSPGETKDQTLDKISAAIYRFEVAHDA